MTSTEPGRAEAVIDLGAYRRNLATMASRVAPTAVMAVVKADAYGHGLLPVARVAVEEGIGWLGALDIPTALELRSAGISTETRIFTWLLSPFDAFAEAVEARVDVGVSALRELEAIAAAVGATRARVHLKIDTGLHRNGASVEDWPALVRRSLELADRVELVGVWTHIAEASDEADSAAIERFQAAIDAAEHLGARFEVRHLAASAAAFARADARFDLVRIGAFGYGIAPGGGVGPASLGLTPVMTLEAPVRAVADDSVEIGLGFGDGIPSAVAGRVDVAINGVRHPITAIGVDWMTVAVAARSVSPGHRAVLFGTGAAGEQTLQEWADALGTIGEELVVRLAPSIRRRYL